ncbi:MAG: DUF2018 family protein [Helicobacter sp.]|nr:DUF2018 family protein [Helicobacter sp.]
MLEDLELFGKSPIDKWKEVILNASPTLVGLELERLLDEICAVELFLESKSIDSQELRSFICGLSKQDKDKLSHLKQSLAIESMGKILGNYE